MVANFVFIFEDEISVDLQFRHFHLKNDLKQYSFVSSQKFESPENTVKVYLPEDLE